MRRSVVAGFVLLGLLFSLSLEATAQPTALKGGKITIGKLRVVPGLTVQEVHDDNIFLKDGTIQPKVSDWITHLMPNMLLNYSLEGRGNINAGYIGDYAYYKDNDNNDWKNHTAIFSADYQAPGGIIAGLENTYINASDPFGSENQYKLGQKTKRWNDLLRNRVGYQFSDRFRALGYYNFYKQDYKLVQDFSQNWDSNEFGVGAEMRVFPRTWAFLRYYYGMQDFTSHPPGFGVSEQNDADFNWHRVNAGLAWDPGGKIRGELNVGYQWKEYENTFDPNGVRYDNRDTWIAGTKVTWAISSTTSLSFTVLRALRDTGSNSSEFFEDTGGSVSLFQGLYHRLNLFATVGYSKNDFNLPLNKPRSQDNFLGNIGLEYQFLEWLAAVASYTYNRKDSNYPQDEYVVNQVLVGLRALY